MSDGSAKRNRAAASASDAAQRDDSLRRLSGLAVLALVVAIGVWRYSDSSSSLNLLGDLLSYFYEPAFTE